MELNLITIIELAAVALIPLIGVIIGYAKLQAKVDRVDRDVSETNRRIEQHERGRHTRSQNLWERINEINDRNEELVSGLRVEMRDGFQRTADGQNEIMKEITSINVRVARLEGIEKERERRD